MKIAIVGSNGFLGKHLSLKLSQNQNLSLYLFGSNFETKSSNSIHYLNKINQYTKSELKTIFKEIDFVFYLASNSIPSTSWENPKLEIIDNLLPFIDFIETIKNSNLKKIIFTSSAGTIYGNSLKKISEESDKSPISPYGINKLTMEYYLKYYKKKYNINYDIYRISNIYGEGQDTSKGLGVINTFIENILKDEDVLIFGDGSNIRNYIYIHDVIEIMTSSCFKETNISNVYNLASNTSISVIELVKLIEKISKKTAKIKHISNRASDNSVIQLNNNKLKRDYKHIKFTSLTKGITKTIKSIKKHL